MNFNEFKQNISNDFEVLLDIDKQINQKFVLKTLTKLFLLVLKQISKLPSFFIDIKNKIESLSSQINHVNQNFLGFVDFTNEHLKNFHEKFEDLDSIISLINTSFISYQDNINDLNKQIRIDLNEVTFPLKSIPKNIERDIFKACSEGKFESVQWLCEIENTNPNTMDKNDDTPLHLAVLNAHLKIVQYLICRHQVEIDNKNKNELTPLHYACLKGNFEIIKYLIDKGANINAVDKYRKTPFHYTLKKVNSSSKPDPFYIIIFLIKKGADIKAKNSYDKTPLHYACESDYLDCTKFLIDLGANINGSDKNGKTPLHYACKSSSLPIVKHLKHRQSC